MMGRVPCAVQWASCSENAFGAFIHLTLQQGLSKGFKQAGFMLAVSAFIQGIYGYELLLALPLPLSSSQSGFCSSVSPAIPIAPFKPALLRRRDGMCASVRACVRAWRCSKGAARRTRRRASC